MTTLPSVAPTGEVGRTPLQAAVILRLTTLDDPGVCAAWMESADRRCGRPGSNHLCPRHEKVAATRLAKQREKAHQSQARIAEKARAEDVANAARLTELRREKAAVDSELLRRTSLPTDDPAAWGGIVNPRLARHRARQWSASNMRRVRHLRERGALLDRLIASGERAS